MKVTFKTHVGDRKVDFTLHGYSYNRNKQSARQVAANVADLFAEGVLDGIQMDVARTIMARIGKKWGLLSEFRELGVAK